jgi:hypothetical protein
LHYDVLLQAIVTPVRELCELHRVTEPDYVLSRPA